MCSNPLYCRDGNPHDGLGTSLGDRAQHPHRRWGVLGVALVALTLVGCGSSPAAPSPPPVLPSPVVTQAPHVLSMAGGWTGTVAITLASQQVSITNVCESTWAVTQTD